MPIRVITFEQNMHMASIAQEDSLFGATRLELLAFLGKCSCPNSLVCIGNPREMTCKDIYRKNDDGEMPKKMAPGSALLPYSYIKINGFQRTSSSDNPCDSN